MKYDEGQRKKKPFFFFVNSDICVHVFVYIMHTALHVKFECILIPAAHLYAQAALQPSQMRRTVLYKVADQPYQRGRPTRLSHSWFRPEDNMSKHSGVLLHLVHPAFS